MEHHASYLAKWLTELFHLTRYQWEGFGILQEEGHSVHEYFSVLERYDHLFNASLAVLVTLIIATWVRTRMTKIPNPLQQVFEMVISGLDDMVKASIAHHAERYLPFVGTIALFVFFNNLFGITPGLSPATSNWNVTLGAALAVFCYYNFHGMKEKGFWSYWGHFAGPVVFLIPLMFPLEILGLLSRNLSHSLRLFGNIAGEHLVAGIFFGILPLFLPIPMLFLGLFFGLIQTFVFTVLSIIYLSGAVAHDH